MYMQHVENDVEEFRKIMWKSSCMWKKDVKIYLEIIMWSYYVGIVMHVDKWRGTHKTNDVELVL